MQRRVESAGAIRAGSNPVSRTKILCCPISPSLDYSRFTVAFRRRLVGTYRDFLFCLLNLPSEFLRKGDVLEMLRRASRALDNG